MSIRYYPFAVYEYVQLGEFDAPPTFPTFADGHREIVLCEAILRSHGSRQWVNIGHHSE